MLGLCCLCLCLPLPAQDMDNKAATLDAYIEKAKRQWEVPGLAVVVVKDDKLVFEKGYGVRQLGQKDLVTKETIFAACSTTKAMTAAGMAMLIDEGKADWDDRVIEHMPDFQLFDPYVTQELRIRDLFTHNSGVGNADLLWYMWKYPPEEIFRKMRDLPPSYPFRGGYTYQNIMYAAAGALIAKLSGQSWEAFTRDRIFQPIGMDHSFANLQLSQGYANRSVPHHRVDGEIVSIPDASADLIASAGSVWSCVEDMQKWMRFVLDSAKVDGQRLISAENYREWLKPQAIVTDAGFYPTQALTKPHWKTYALGWFQHDYRGRAVSFHTGSLQGTVAIIGLIPQERLGVYVFGNLDHAEVRHAIMYKVFDLFGSDDPNRDWSTEFLELYQRRQEEAEARDIAQDTEPIEPAFIQEAFEGKYVDDYLGEIAVYLEDDQLLGRFGEDVPVKFKHKSLHTFYVQYLDHPWRRDGVLRFIDDGSDITSLRIFGRTFYRRQP